ncbi:hypothetical protein like AT4G29090 [Hibiscus trionum]|uniref:RNase H type-1 domain-containing protein n=1 Tax=Hibiscus trionum TaxID=183268 RepID=A0A9W7ISR6_HIBTR|nr:hypothetical protein like AT4G29090 [Hibiscus trionum]
MPVAVKKLLTSLITKFLWGSMDRKTIHWISRDTILRPKSCGGLGLVNFAGRNRALLSKWVWRFGVEQNSLWRKLINTKYKESEDALIPRKVTSGRKYWVWKNIVSPLANPSSVVSQNLHLLVGNGENIQFWSDVWAGSAPLKDSFPRIYNLAIEKSGPIAKFGRFVNEVWSWEICLRRELFECEKVVWAEFIPTLECGTPGRFLCDGVRWKGVANGIYSVKNYCEILNDCNRVEDEVWAHVWSNSAPPKVEAFMWRMVHERLPTRCELAKRGVGDLQNLVCPLYFKELETVNHLFCTCEVSWRIWTRWFQSWGVSFVILGDVKSLVLAWVEVKIPYLAAEIWKASLFLFCWSIWLYRNERVFKDCKADEIFLYNNILARLGLWCKIKYPWAFHPSDIILQDPLLLKNVKAERQCKSILEWTKPLVDSLKFNVDGAVVGGFGNVGIRGILRDWNNVSIAMFSKCIGTTDATTAELLALNEAICMFKKLKKVGSGALILETDSSLCVGWIRNPSTAPGIFVGIIKECLSCCSDLTWSIQWAPREANQTADKLARSGLNRQKPFIWER